MNEVYVSKVKQIWGSTEGTWRATEWLHWLQHPKVQERINVMATGDSGKDRYQYFLEHYCPLRLPSTAHSSQTGAHSRLRPWRIRKRSLKVQLCGNPRGCGYRRWSGCRSNPARGSPRFQHILVNRVADLNTIELPESSYDVVFGISSIHHVAQLEHLFREVLLSLKPGGYFVLDEFIGPSQFQWPDEQVAIINEQLEKLPEEFKYAISNSVMVKACVARPSLEHMNTYDPSEAIRSGEIMESRRGSLRLLTSKVTAEPCSTCSWMKSLATSFRTIRVRWNIFPPSSSLKIN